ncbi:MAG: hypothetical protein Q8T09_07490 [Candidatus Melainabacteria bacterium]|nr:hypothetical protein [Candidatus Melainabacteria bacterium]
MTMKNHHTQQEISLKLLAAISLLFFLIAIHHCLSFAGVESRQLGYIKLAKFSASLALYAVTMFWLLKQLTSDRPILEWAAIGACLGGTLELSTLMIQALAPTWQSTALLSIGRLAILPPSFLILVSFRQLLNESIPKALRSALLWATGLAMFGCLPGGLMLIEIGQHQSSSALSLPSGLKLAHFAALHTLQLMPMAYFLISKQITSEDKQIKVIDSIGLVLLVLIALLTLTSTTAGNQTMATVILTLCAVFLVTNQAKRLGSLALPMVATFHSVEVRSKEKKTPHY